MVKKERKRYDTAVAGQADYLVSQDKHFSVLENINFPFVRLLNIEQFAEKIRVL